MTKGSSFLGILFICAYGEPVQGSVPATQTGIEVAAHFDLFVQLL
jgi:hypothetical protein